MFVSSFGLSGALAVEPIADGRLTVELNKLEPRSADLCRVYLVVANRTAFDPNSFVLDLVLFDRGGIVSGQTAVDAGPLTAGRSGLKLFDLPVGDCTGVGQILLNSVRSCNASGSAAPGDAPACLALVDVRSRAAIVLVR